MTEDMYYNAVDAIADNHLAKVIEQFRAAIDTDESFTDAWHGLARALQDTGNLDAALATALRLTKLEPDDVLVHMRLSILYQLQGKIPKAKAEMSRPAC